MTTHLTTVPLTDRSSGRGLFWAGIGVSVLAIVLLVAQFVLKQLIVPWYFPVLTTIGVLLLLASVAQRRSIVRILVLILIIALAGLEWFFVASFSKLPAYEGPARAGLTFPAFRTTRADGRPFTEQDLEDGRPTVMTFFRGRW